MIVTLLSTELFKNATINYNSIQTIQQVAIPNASLYINHQMAKPSYYLNIFNDYFTCLYKRIYLYYFNNCITKTIH